MSGPVASADAAAAPACGSPTGPTVEVLESRRSTVGALEVRRALPRRTHRTVGAWCFADHMGPVAVTEEQGVDIGPHPHIGLQTVTWLLAGEILHRDSLGSEQVIRPGQLNLMTAGRGSPTPRRRPASYRGDLHGIQLWVAQPEATRHGEPAFEHHAELPRSTSERPPPRCIVGALDGVTSPARRDTDHLGVELDAPARRGPRAGTCGLRARGSWCSTGRCASTAPPSCRASSAYLGAGRDELALVDPRGADAGAPAARRGALRRGDPHVVELRGPQPRRGRGGAADLERRRWRSVRPCGVGPGTNRRPDPRLALSGGSEEAPRFLPGSGPSVGAMADAARLLVVDDEDALVDMLRDALRFAGYEVHVARRGFEALAAAAEVEPDLIILDVNLPDIDGFEICRRLRAAGSEVPVVFLTARDDRDDVRTGFTRGGDDYLTKPFSLEELDLACKPSCAAAAPRAGERPEEEERLRCGDVELDVAAHRVWRGGEEVELSATEFRLLRYLVVNQGRVLSKTQILDHVWQYDFDGDGSIVETYISYLRRKVDRGESKLIRTVRGVGYAIRSPTTDP